MNQLVQELGFTKERKKETKCSAEPQQQAWTWALSCTASRAAVYNFPD